MSVGTVSNAVVADAKKIAKQYDTQLEEKRNTRISEINYSIDKLKLKKKEALKDKVALLAKTETSRTNLEIKRKRLRMEHDILEEVLLDAKKRLADLAPEKREQIINKLISLATLQYFYSNKMDEEYVKKIVKERYKGNVTCLGGVITEDISGKTREEFTFDSILTYVFNNDLKHIRDLLFGEAEYGFQCNII
ncbi:MAG: hypothetical protein GYA51_00940 [Candidatus Methanofastidiosa archaeon]|jgi:V/A-type H+-transporting ATPase subunit E|nr:hypothetical protein [Candidatus Methanofastidiosa archaeon]